MDFKYSTVVAVVHVNGERKTLLFRKNTVVIDNDICDLLNADSVTLTAGKSIQLAYWKGFDVVKYLYGTVESVERTADRVL